MSPFFTNYRFDPLWQFNFSNKARLLTEHNGKQLAAKFKEITEHLQAEMLRAQYWYQEQANKKRAPAPAFKINDLVWFNAQTITTQRSSRKLDHQRIGPYKITKIISPYAYEINFPTTVKYHKVQYVSLLDPADNDPLPR